MNLLRRIISGVLFLPFLIHGQIVFTSDPSLTPSTFRLPFQFEASPISNLSIEHRSFLFNIHHPQNRYLWYSYQREELSFITEFSSLQYRSDPIILQLGRNYLDTGAGQLSGLFISPKSPALDHMKFSISDFHNISLSNLIIRLDNRQSEWDGETEIAQRWMYFRSIGYKWNKRLEINFFDAVVATGFNRGLEWYYLNPFSSLFMERKHQYIWREGGDSTTVIGIGDNDNHFIGGDWKIKGNNGDVYGEWLIDEWQLSSQYRDSMQTVFGVLLGIEYRLKPLKLILEYFQGSPWLYLSRGLYNSPEYHGLPLGLRSPQSAGFALSLEYSINPVRSLTLETYIESHSRQSLTSKWEAWDNHIPPEFIYDHWEATEIKLMYSDNQGKYFNEVGVYVNWLGNNGVNLYISKLFRIFL